MHLKRLELQGFKSFAEKSEFVFDVPIIAIVGPNGSGKSNVVESIRFVLGEQSIKSMRGKTGADLIFKGSSDIQKKSRASVTIVFDNIDRVFRIENNDNSSLSVDFDEIAITREVFADGTNTYSINGNEVRMKDVHNLIASVNIGSSGHHIISQGEADRYLNAGVKDRRILIEEALGLKIYQYRIKESERKLEKSLENLRESELIRRELAPHLRFLKRQVDQIERARSLRVELEEKYKTYLAQEDALLARQAYRLESEYSTLESEYQKITDFMNTHTVQVSQESEHERLLQGFTQQLQDVRNVISDIQREQGRIEGMIDVLSKPNLVAHTPTQNKSISFDEVKTFIKSIVHNLENLNYEQSGEAQKSITQVIQKLIAFTQTSPEKQEIHDHNEDNRKSEILTLTKQKQTLELAIQEHESTRAQIERALSECQETIAQEQLLRREEDKKYYEFLAKKTELDGKKALWESEERTLNIRMQRRHEEHEEAKTLLGIAELEYTQIPLEDIHENAEQVQETQRREIERIKIRIEDIGGGSGVDVIREFEETKERDQFLEREIQDITQSIESLQAIITQLKDTLRIEFEEGIGKINTEFNRFFGLMFGGGKASLGIVHIQKRKSLSHEETETVSEEDESPAGEYGIDIHVELPRKKVSDLQMLSGGERSLTSIALLFALSQVNPPPFLVLDETDAALDEANSKKYGDMIESLSQYSQLVIVTHNRETMSRAQTLFGVTLGRNDSSTVLSLRLEDASKYAK